MVLLTRLLAFNLVAVLPAVAVLVSDPDTANLRVHVAAALALGVLIGFGVMSLSRRRFIDAPLRDLMAFADALREGRYPPRGALAIGPREFAPLARAFEHMAAQLQAREAALKESEQRFRRLSDASFEGVAIHDGERVIEANAAAARIFGYEPGEVIGMPLTAFLAPETRKRALETARAEVEACYESLGVRKDGSVFPVEFRGRRIEHEGRPRRIIAIRDLTEQKRAAAALAESEERLKLAMAAGGLGTWDFDLANRRVRVDARLATMLGIPPEKTEAPVEDWLTFIHPKDRSRLRAAFTEQLKSGTSEPVEYCVTRADGGERWYASQAIVLRRRNGEPFRAVGVTQDITDRKQAESRLRLLAAEVDHRSKNMLALVQIMLRQTRAATVGEFAAAAQGRVAALARAHTLLSQSQWGSVDLKRLADEELAPFRPADGKRIGIDGPPMALSSRAAQSFALVLHELATNAAKYGALSLPSGRASLTWACRADERLVLRWTEEGGPPVQPPSRQGLGTNVIDRSIRGQLEGEVRFDWRPEGLVCEIAVPMTKLSQRQR